jgi:gliding motility-associated-like protein
MRGSAGPNNVPPNHGVLGVPAQSNTPGGRWTDSRWRDSNGNFWLFSGMTGTFNTPYADVWKLNPTTLLWTWMGGANTTNFTDSFTVKCSFNGGSPASADLNTVCWIDDCDRLWQFGGEGRNPFSVGYTNSTWFFDPASGDFKWQGGDLAYLQQGVYGAQGVSSTLNYPPSAMGGIGFNDNQGNFWMFGGCITPLFAGAPPETNTMWKFRPDSLCASLPSFAPIQASISASSPSACTPLEYNFQSNTVNSSFTYQWNFGDNSSSQNTASTANAGHSFSGPGIYTVTLIVSVAGSCFFGVDTATFQVDISNVIPLQSFITATTCSNYTAPWGAVYTQSGLYSDTVAASNGCDSIINLTLNITGFPTVNASSVSGTCGQPNGTVTAISTGGSGNYSYTWSNGATGSFISGLISGSYSVVATDQNGCTASAQVAVSSTSASGVSLIANDTLLEYGDSVTLQVLGANTYLWAPPDGLSCTNCPSVIASPLASTIYQVTGVDSSGCGYLLNVKIEVEIELNEIFVPDAFSPNSDGINDKVFVRGSIKEFSFSVFNRWGEVVFRTQNQSQGWDGSYRSKELDAGVFVYYLSGTDATGNSFNKKGNITLVK